MGEKRVRLDVVDKFYTAKFHPSDYYSKVEGGRYIPMRR